MDEESLQAYRERIIAAQIALVSTYLNLGSQSSSHGYQQQFFREQEHFIAPPQQIQVQQPQNPQNLQPEQQRQRPRRRIIRKNRKDNPKKLEKKKEKKNKNKKKRLIKINQQQQENDIQYQIQMEIQQNDDRAMAEAEAEEQVQVKLNPKGKSQKKNRPESKQNNETNSGRWSYEENYRYLKAFRACRDVPEQKIQIGMISDLIETRTKCQIRAHHQKMTDKMKKINILQLYPSDEQLDIMCQCVKSTEEVKNTMEMMQQDIKMMMLLMPLQSQQPSPMLAECVC